MTPFYHTEKDLPALGNYKQYHPLLFNNYFLLLGRYDVHDIPTRSYNTSRIKGKNTKPELLVRKFLFANPSTRGYRLIVKSLQWKPDIVLPKFKTVIFVNGCFWHGHKGYRYFVLHKTRIPEYLGWLQKIKGTPDLINNTIEFTTL